MVSTVLTALAGAGAKFDISHGFDRREQPLDLRLRQIARDEDEAGAAVGIGPVFQLDRAVRDVLYGVHHDGAAAAFDRDKTFDPQQIGAAQPRQDRHRLLEDRPGQGPLEKQRKAVDPVAMGMRVFMLVPRDAR